MGNTKSIHKHRRRHRKSLKKGNYNSARLQNLKKAFNLLSDGNQDLNLSQLTDKLDNLADPIFNYLNDGTGNPVTFEQFCKNAPPFVGNSTDIYVKLFMPLDNLLKTVFSCANISYTEDETFFDVILNEIKSNGEEAEDVIKWKNTTCPGLCLSIQSKIFEAFFKREIIKNNYKSTLLSRLQMYILEGMLPITVYFPGRGEFRNTSGNVWSLLYSSKHDGISINRFNSKSFHYRGATVVVFKKTDKSIYVIANDEEWKHSTKMFGGDNSMLIQLAPEFRCIIEREEIYCNFLLKSSMFGINFGGHFKIEGDMSDVAAIETWGCGGESLALEQDKTRERIRKVTEQRRKIPLPGNWDENPDKVIMEMGGFKFSNERKYDRPDDSER